MDSEEQRNCIACDVALVGPFQPKIALTLPAEEPGQEAPKVSAYSWICPDCGLVHWYAEGVTGLPAPIPADEAEAPRPDSSYQRRTQMLRMLRRVKRM